jgi:predicted GIY-YIG superfamily endonuclease
MTAHRPHALYRFFDAKDALLYVGITNSLTRRWGQHENEKTWFTDVARATVEHHPTRDAVFAAEKVAIQREKPRFNVVHNRSRVRVASIKDEGRWYFQSRHGHARTSNLWLYPELDCSSMVDDYYDCHGEEQLEEYVSYLKRNHPEWLERNAVPIHWSVCGNAGVHEAAPFAEDVPWGDFLAHFTWPFDPKTGEALDWYRLPVVNDRFPEFAKALAWTPSPLQPTCPLASILGSRGGYGQRFRRAS